MSSLNEMSQKEINQFARSLYKANMIIWNAIHIAEEITHSEVFNNYDEYSDESQEFLKKLAKAYKKVNKDNKGFADAELYGAAFQEFTSFTSELEEIIESIDI